MMKSVMICFAVLAPFSDTASVTTCDKVFSRIIRRDEGPPAEIWIHEEIDAMATRYCVLNCSDEALRNYSEANITWEYNPRSNFKEVLYKGKEIRIADSTDSRDEGNYTCTITADGIKIKKVFSVCVTKSDVTEDPPVGGSISPKTYSYDGDSVTLNCSAYIGSPRCLLPYPYTAQWSRVLENGILEPIDALEGVSVSQDMVENGIMRGHLEIRTVQSSHYGVYQCNITNQFGSLVQNVTVTDEVPPEVKRERTIWLACIILLFMCFFLLFSIGFLHRIRITLALYYKQKNMDPSLAHNYKWDALVVHSLDSHYWVWEVLRFKLEKEKEFQCYFPERDMIGGGDTISIIAELVPKCRHIVVVETPSLLEDDKCTWAINQAYNSAIKTHSNIVLISLQRIKKKKMANLQHYQMEALRILEKLRRIRVPSSCQLESPKEKKSRLRHKSRADTMDDPLHDLRVSSAVDAKSGHGTFLDFPSVDGECVVRSRSKSPNQQRVRNMINVVNERLDASIMQPTKIDQPEVENRPDLDDRTFPERKGGEDERRGGLLEGDLEGIDLEGIDLEGIDLEGGGGAGGGNIRSKGGLMINFHEQYEDQNLMEENEPPNTPSSTTPFINDNGSLKRKRFTWQWPIEVLKGEDEGMFWRKIQLSLSPPLSKITNEGV